MIPKQWLKMAVKKEKKWLCNSDFETYLVYRTNYTNYTESAQLGTCKEIPTVRQKSGAVLSKAL